METLIRLCKSPQNSQYSICHDILMLHWKVNNDTLKLKEKNKPLSLPWTDLPASNNASDWQGSDENSIDVH